MHRHLRSAAAALLAASALLACSHAKAPAPDHGGPPVSLEPVSGSPVKRVVLTEAAADRIGVRTQPVGGTAARPTVPTSAVLYDPAGASWVFTPDGPLSYLRSPITVQRATAGEAVLSAGPKPGTPVVVQGVPELLGAEYGVGEE